MGGEGLFSFGGVLKEFYCLVGGSGRGRWVSCHNGSK